MKKSHLSHHQRPSDEIAPSSGNHSDTTAANLPQTTPKFITWQLSETNDIIGFSLTKCRTDLLNRLKYNHLYTLEESKILLKQVLKIVTKQAEQDLKNLMFLSKYRTEKLYPKPIVANWLDPDGNITKIGGFQDSEEFLEIINRRVAPEKRRNTLSGDLDDETMGKETTAPGSNNSSPTQEQHLDSNEDAEEPTKQEDTLHPNQEEFHDIDSEVSLSTSKEKLQSLIWRINQSLIKLIDSSLKQRRERLLLSATILEELESVPALKKQMQEKYDYSMHASVAERQRKSSAATSNARRR